MARRCLFITLLCLAFGLSLSLSAAQAAAMSVQMAMMPGMGMTDSHDCGGCAGGVDKDGAKYSACIQLCVPALAAVLPDDLTVAAAEAAPQAAFRLILELGLAPAPNPSPPRA